MKANCQQPSETTALLDDLDDTITQGKFWKQQIESQYHAALLAIKREDRPAFEQAMKKRTIAVNRFRREVVQKIEALEQRYHNLFEQ